MELSQMRKVIIDITPPFLRNALIKYKSRNAYPELNFKYWQQEKKNFEHELEMMIDSYLASDDFNQTTKYWRYLLRQNLESIREFGVENYGQHAAKNYFTFTDFSDDTIKNLVHTAGAIGNLEILKKHEGFSISESIKHNVLIQLLLNTVLENRKSVEYLQKISSSGFAYGNHPKLESRFGSVTLDMLSSILEIESVFSTIGESSVQKILEIGAGSGRLANAILEVKPDAKFVIADIPPASYVAMSRLRYTYPEKKIYFVYDAAKLKEYLHNPNSWDILFLLPNLLPYFPVKYFDIMLAVDCLHEMNEKMRHFYAGIATLKSHFYY
ncbi:putative sugar O-methyltransferase, partial [bacterium]|nr:putative sugar O-methyltransferase [bacterium]